ncbi:MAG: DeoR family transcriptional regulator [Peptostreptococcaceae bacterium]|nr:DeoR family transcriptional regulator [Peptostreptococcaceae bacterium]
MIEISQRQLTLLKRITGKIYCTISELAEQFKVSRETIRKELLELEKFGLIERKLGKIYYIDTEENATLLESSGVLSKNQRRHRILQLLEKDNEIRISTLAHKLRVSTITVRSDISALELEGSVIRKHGSVALFESSLSLEPKNGNNEFPTRIKILGRHTIMHITPGETIFLDSGEVSQYVAASVPPYSNIPIVTNSLVTLDILRLRKYAYQINVTGTLVSTTSDRIGMQSDKVSNASLPTIDKAFICCSSFANNTFFLHDDEDIMIIDSICSNAKKIYIILDSKFLDVQTKKPFRHRQFISKIQEILIDDGISSSRASVLFSRQDPLVICGYDFTYRNVNKNQYRIGFLINNRRNYFIQAVQNSLLEATSLSHSASLVTRECDGDYNSTINNLNILLEEHVDLIIDYSLCMESLMYVGERCLSSKIRLISVDYMAPGAIYFGADNALAGKIAGDKAAEYIKSHWQGKLQHLLVLGKYGNEPITKLRIFNALEQLGLQVKIDETTIDTIEWGIPDDSPTQRLVRLLKEIPQEENMLIMAFNLQYLLAGYDLILQHRNSKNTIIVGQNYTKQIEELMKIGESPIIGCVHYNPETYGEQIINLALRMLDNEEVNPRNFTQLKWMEK